MNEERITPIVVEKPESPPENLNLALWTEAIIWGGFDNIPPIIKMKYQ